MADLRYVKTNRLRQEAHRRRAWIVGVGLPLAAFSTALHPIVCVTVLCFAVFCWRRQERLLKGALGEDRALGADHPSAGALALLSDDYVVFRQVAIPNPYGRPREADFVVVGPNGIFVIESKYYCGVIEGRENQAEWTRYRPGSAKGSPTTNPVFQVRGAMRALSAYLATRGSRAWLEPIVVFTHPSSRVVVDWDSVPVLALHELASHIAGHRPRRPVTCQEAVVAVLRELVDGESAPEATPDVPVRRGRPIAIGRIMEDVVSNRVKSFMAYNVKAALRRQLWRKRLGLAPRGPSLAPSRSNRLIDGPLRQFPIRRLPAQIPTARRRRRRLRIVERKVEWTMEKSSLEVHVVAGPIDGCDSEQH